MVKILISLLTVLALSSCQFAEAQQRQKVWRVGVIHIGLDHVPPSFPALREALKALGYVEGKNIHLDWRNLPDEAAARATAREFAEAQIDLIVALEDQTIRATKAAHAEIPVLFLHASTAAIDGFVESYAHPGGNMTGFVAWPVSYGKQVELFKELIPGLRRLLLIVHPADPVGQRWLNEARRAGEALNVGLLERQAKDQGEIENLLRSIKREEVDGVLVPSQILRNAYSSLVITLTSEKRLPLGMHRKKWVERGALFSYSADLASVGRAAAPYVDKILKGTKAGDLPVDQVSRFELVINLKNANQLGLTIPQWTLMKADTVIK